MSILQGYLNRDTFKNYKHVEDVNLEKKIFNLLIHTKLSKGMRSRKSKNNHFRDESSVYILIKWTLT